MKSKAVRTDTSKLGERVAGRRHPDRVGLPHGHQELPYDLPLNIEVERVMAVVGDPPTMGLIGWILEMFNYTSGKTVRLKMYRDPQALAFEVDGDEVWRWVRHPDDIPVKVHEVREEMSRIGNDFADALELEPGDEVLDGDEPGTYIVNRATEAKHERRAKRADVAAGSKRKATKAPTYVEGDDVLD